jgi:hypothetical protein
MTADTQVTTAATQIISFWLEQPSFEVLDWFTKQED